MTNHNSDDWYTDTGMHGVRVVVRNGGLQLSRYVPELTNVRFPDVVLRAFLADMDREWKHECERRSE